MQHEQSMIEESHDRETQLLSQIDKLEKDLRNSTKVVYYYKWLHF
jgi:hypothetical protein